MRIIKRNDIDVPRWNELVSRDSSASFFSYAWYLDAVSDEWMIAVNEDYSFGMALPITGKFGIEILYTPPFVRYLEVLGKGDLEVLKALILGKFTYLNFTSREKIFDFSMEDRVFQKLEHTSEWSQKSQAKRMLKKASKNALKVRLSNSFESVYNVIRHELTGKVHGINDRTMMNLHQLFNNAAETGALRVFQVGDGGIVCLQNDHTLLYLKGTVSGYEKKNGGMYLALNEAIDFARKNNLNVDFGGSNADGVKRFNHNLGGNDVPYFSTVKLDLPWWYKILKRIKRFL